MALIFYMSQQNGADSSDVSNDILLKIADICRMFFGSSFKPDDLEWFMTNLMLPLRKSAHFLEYLILGILSFVCAEDFKLSNGKRMAVCFVFCVLYALTDEFHQTFIPGRSGNLTDVMIDSMGSLLGILTSLTCIRLFYRSP